MNTSRWTIPLTSDLDRLYRATPAVAAAGCVDNVEQHIADTLVAAIRFAILQIEPLAAPSGDKGFILDGVSYDAIIDTRDLLRADTVGVLIASLRAGIGRSPKPARARIRIHGDGKYKKAEVIAPARLAAALEPALELTKAIYETGYSWLTAFLRDKVLELESAMAVELYRVVRLVFAGSQQLAELVWLVLIQEDHGIYLFDQDAMNNAVSLLGSKRGAARRSPAALFVELLTSAVPFDRMFSRHAIPTGECLHCDLSQAEYAGTEPLYAVAEHVLYKSGKDQSTVASILPLVRNEQPYLIAAFPASHETEIVELLKEHLDQIVIAFEQQKSHARQLFKKVSSVTGLPLPPPGKTGEFFGGFFKGALGI